MTKQITLATLHEATAQEVFDQVATHLLTQGTQAVAGGACVYRGNDGTKCAAGSLIADSEYRAFFEMKDWKQLCEKLYVPSAHAELVHALQLIHDKGSEDSWAERLTSLANELGLSATAVTNFQQAQR